MVKIFCPGVTESRYQLLIYAEHVDAEKTHRDFKACNHQLIGSVVEVKKFCSEFIGSSSVRVTRSATETSAADTLKVFAPTDF